MSQVERIDRLLELARHELAPSEGDLARSRLALGLPSKPSTIVRIEHEPRPTRSWSALRASGTAGLTAGALLLGAGFAAGYWSAQRTDTAPTRANSEARGEPAAPPSPVEPAVPPAVATPAPDTAARATRAEPARLAARDPASRRRHRPAEAGAQELTSAPATAALGDELALLRRVERALRAEDPALALALLSELEQRFPTTDLVEERAAANVLARCGTREPDWRLVAERFLQKRPTSVYAERIRTSCALESTARGAGEGSPAAGHE
jgi:hypothetical protein